MAKGKNQMEHSATIGRAVALGKPSVPHPAHLLEELGEQHPAIQTYHRSIALTTGQRNRHYLQTRMAKLTSQSDG